MLGVLLATSSDKAHEAVGVNSLLFVSLVCICLFLGYNLKKHKIYGLPESGASMILGLFIGGLFTLFDSQDSEGISFSPEIFFYGLLPPIIFEAGFTLQRRDFFRNFTTILLFAVFGTLVSTLIIGFGMFYLAKAGLVPISAETPLEGLLFGSLISAVDPIATLAILGAREINADPLLYSLVFGESVLNDAVSIVLFKTFERYADRSTDETLADATVGDFVGTFVKVSLGSIAIGVGSGLACSFMLKQANLKTMPAYEFTILLLFAYANYCIAEILYMSGIVSLFFCGITMAHYAMYNVSKTTQTSSHHVFKSFAMLAETFVFGYLGIYAGIHLEKLDQNWSFLMIVFSLILCFIARAVNIFPFSFIANLRRKRKIPFNMQMAMWFAGLRGAIAFALALNVPSVVLQSPGHPTTSAKSFIVSTTLVIVFFTTLVCGGLTERVLSRLNLRNPGAAQSAHGDESPSMSGVVYRPLTVDHDDSVEDNEEHRGVHRLWRKFDDRVMKRWFGGREDTELPRRQIVDEDDFSVHLPSSHGTGLDFSMSPTNTMQRLRLDTLGSINDNDIRRKQNGQSDNNRGANSRQEEEEASSAAHSHPRVAELAKRGPSHSRGSSFGSSASASASDAGSAFASGRASPAPTEPTRDRSTWPVSSRIELSDTTSATTTSATTAGGDDDPSRWRLPPPTASSPNSSRDRGGVGSKRGSRDASTMPDMDDILSQSALSNIDGI